MALARLRDMFQDELLERAGRTTVSFEMSWNAIFTGDPAHAWLRGVLSEVAGA